MILWRNIEISLLYGDVSVMKLKRNVPVISQMHRSLFRYLRFLVNHEMHYILIQDFVDISFLC